MSIENPETSSHFIVEWGGSRVGFSEVSGLSIKIDTIEYREGSSPVNSTLKFPGSVHYNNITLKRGILAGDNELFDWINSIRFSKAERRDVRIKLLNENHEPVVVWKIKNAFPVKLIGPTFNASTSEVAIEEVELAHEGLTIEHG